MKTVIAYVYYIAREDIEEYQPDCGLKPTVAVLLLPEISAAESLELSLKVSAISKFLLRADELKYAYILQQGF